MNIKETKNTASAENIEKKDTAEKPEKVKKNGQRKQFFQTTMRIIGFGFLFLLIGGLVVLLSLYLPAASELKKAHTELDRLVPIETEYLLLQKEYQTVSTQASVNKILSNSSLLQIAIIDNNTYQVNQYIQYVEDGLKNLNIPKFPEIAVDLTNQFAKVKSLITSDRLKAIDDLQDFHKDLLLLIDNLE